MIIKKTTLLLFAVGFIVYFNSLFNSFVWDDEEQVVNNILVHSLKNIPAFFSGSTFNTGGSGELGGIYYKPMMSLSFSFLYTLFGPNPFFFHLFQLIIHIANSTLFYNFLISFFGSWQALFLALIFLVHPINTETVIYVSALQDTLYFFFGMLALRLFQKSFLTPKTYFTGGLLLLFSLLSKETGFLFIPLILTYMWIFRQKNLRLFIFSAATVITIYSWLRFIVAQVSFNHSGPSPIFQTTLWERFYSIPNIILYYLQTFLFPKNLAISQHWIVKYTPSIEFYLPLILVGLLSLGLVGILVLIHYKKSPLFPSIFFFTLWIGFGLGLHLQIIPLDMTVAERWFYFPMAGLLGLLGFIFQKVYRTKTVTVFLVIIIVLLSIRTIVRTNDWRNGLTLYSHDVKISQNAFDLENNLGVELFRSGNINEAAIHFQKSTELAPHWWTNWNNLGVIHERQEDFENARSYYQRAVDNGNYYLAYENLSKLLISHFTLQEAEKFTESAITRFPQNPVLWLNLSLIKNESDKPDEALSAAKKAYLLSPGPQTYGLYNSSGNSR